VNESPGSLPAVISGAVRSTVNGAQTGSGLFIIRRGDDLTKSVKVATESQPLTDAK
jgi:hypothetical protein